MKIPDDEVLSELLKSHSPRRVKESFQQQVRNKESKIKGRISVPSDLAIEDDQAMPPEKHVLRAIVTMHEAFAPVFQSIGLGANNVVDFRMTPCYGQKIRIDPQLSKILPGIELAGRLGIVQRVLMNATQKTARLLSVLRARNSFEKVRLPGRVSGIEVRHDVISVSTCQHRGNRVGHKMRHVFQITLLKIVARDVCN